MPELPLPDPELTDVNVRLRAWRASGAPAIVAACQDPAISRFSPAIPFPYRDSDAQGWLDCQEPARLADTGSPPRPAGMAT